MTLNKKERALLVKIFYQNGSNYSATLKEYRRMKRLRRGPMSVNGLKNMISKFEETGELGVIPGTRGRRPVNPETVQQIDNAIATTSSSSGGTMQQQVSGRSVARILSIPWPTVHKVLRQILRRYPYKIKVLQELKPRDDTLRIDFANFVLSKISEDDTWIQRILWTDEAHFTLSGSVNAHNCRIWGTSNPYAKRDSDYVTVWCGMTCDFLVGPFFFETPTPSGPKRCSVTGTSYSAMLREQLIPALQERNCLETTVFMQDGAPPHIAKEVKKLLRDTFGADRLISRGFDNAWPPRSPDLNPCDFYLWGHLKDMVYRERHASVADLKSSIKRHVRCVTPEILNATVDHAVLRFQHVVASGGSHIEHIM